MADYHDRDVPHWPDINERAITPDGYGEEQGNQPCFCTNFGYIDVYLLHSTAVDIKTAREIFEGLEPEVMKIVSHGPHDRSASVNTSAGPRHFWLRFVFGTIIPEESDRPHLLKTISRYWGQKTLPPD